MTRKGQAGSHAGVTPPAPSSRWVWLMAWVIVCADVAFRYRGASSVCVIKNVPGCLWQSSVSIYRGVSICWLPRWLSHGFPRQPGEWLLYHWPSLRWHRGTEESSSVLQVVMDMGLQCSSLAEFEMQASTLWPAHQARPPSCHAGESMVKIPEPWVCTKGT